MQIILQKNVTHLGMVGDVVDVKPGFFRNFLGPRKLALLANPGSVRQIEHQKKMIEAKKAKQKEEAYAIKQKIEAHVVRLEHVTGGGDKLFGSITAQEIASSLRGNGFEVDRKLVKIEVPIKTVGEHQVEVKLHPEVSAQVKVEVVKK